MRPGGNGDVTDTHMAWHTPRNGGRDCPSPIVVGNYVIGCDMTGIATCYDADDGHIYWKDGSTANSAARPSRLGGLVYFSTEAGKTIVIKPGQEFDSPSPKTALPAGKDEIFLRLADAVRRTAFHPQHERAVLRWEEIVAFRSCERSLLSRSERRHYARISFTSRPCTSVRR